MLSFPSLPSRVSLAVVHKITGRAYIVIRAIEEGILRSILGLHTKEEECHASDELTAKAQ